MARLLIVLAFFLLVAPRSSAQTTWVVDDNGTGDFVHIQDAVDAAQDGDVLFVLSGAYSGFTIDGKALVVAGEPGGNTLVAAFCTVRNLAAEQRVELENLRMGLTFAGTGSATLSLFDNLGSVRVVDCELRGPTDSALYYNDAPQSVSSDDVGILRSSFQGGYDYYYGGGAGINANLSNLLITDSTVVGGDGWTSQCCCIPGGNGANGLQATGGTVVCVGSSFEGGEGGDVYGGCNDFSCGFGTCFSGIDGGAFAFAGGTTGSWKDSTFTGGPGPETGPFARTEFAAFCFGTWDECPCGNNGAPAAGCETSYGSGGVELSAAGTPSVGGDTVTLSATGFRTTGFPSGLFFQGLNPVGGGLGALFNDGLLCVTGDIIRLKGKIAQNGSMTFGFGNPVDQPVSVRGAIPPEGGTRVYQVWYRNQAPQWCTAERFNMSNGLEITWVP